jgi:hypothetical protein
MDRDYSVDAFMRFLDYAAKKGLVKLHTVRARKTSSKRLLDLLDPDEKQDLKSLDLDHLAERFANKEGTGFKPESLQTYQRRLKTALEDFFAFTENPRSFKPTSAARASRQSGPARPDRSGRTSSKAGGSPSRETGVSPGLDSLVFPIPLRPGVVVKLCDIPPDLTDAEAEKVAAVIKALAVKTT